MEKIVVIGSPGAGKSTFAQALGANLGIKVWHLDRYFWQPGWKKHSREERVRIQQEIVEREERWIMEGSYISSADGRLDAADTIIFLDTPRLLCLWRVIKRHIETYQQLSRPDLPAGCTDKLGLLCIVKILVFPHKGKTLLRAKIRQREQGQAEQKEIYTLSSNQEIKQFLQEQATRQQKKHEYTEQGFAQKCVPITSLTSC